MENKGLSSKQSLENYMKAAEADPIGFFASIEPNKTKSELEEIFSFFISHSENSSLIKFSIGQINEFRFENNVDDLIDFLMSNRLNNLGANEVINLKIYAIKALSNYNNTKCIPALLYCLNDHGANYKMRFQAAEALGKIGDKNAVESLINVVSDEEEKSLYVRESAAVALGMIGDMRAIDPFLTILEAKKAFIGKFTFLKERVIEALGKINFSNSTRVITAFKNALEDESNQVKINAIECLMNSGADEAYDLIKTKLDDSDSEVVKNAVIALYNLKGEEALFEILKDETINPAARLEADRLYAEYEDEENHEE